MKHARRTNALVLIALFWGAHVSAQPTNSDVPPDYVATPYGYFHSSCIKEVSDLERVKEDGEVVDISTGLLKRMLANCDYPTFVRSRASNNGSPPSINGWWYWAQNVPNTVGMVSLSAQWTVPINGPGTPAGNLYFFPGLQTSEYAGFILQPVLGYNQAGGPSGWSIASWNCCASGNAIHSGFYPVSPGQSIAGHLLGTNCAFLTGACTNWEVDTSVTTGSGIVTETIYTDSYGHQMDEIFGGVVEAYNVSCSQMPIPPIYFVNLTAASYPNHPLTWNLSTGADETSCASTFTIHNATPTSVRIAWPCPGCIDGSGTCHTGLESAFCGPAGQACTNCLDLGEICSTTTHTCHCTKPGGCF